VSRPGRSLPPRKTRYPLYRRLGGPHGRSGQVRKISPPPEFDPRTVQSRSQSLYRLSYPAHYIITYVRKMFFSKIRAPSISHKWHRENLDSHTNFITWHIGQFRRFLCNLSKRLFKYTVKSEYFRQSCQLYASAPKSMNFLQDDVDCKT
jgi:hypothetical protein